ncbi:hypothetical protein ACNQGL_12125 [Flavobacterium sp. LB3P21]|uniref:hypothetical protein n=1 Tax=Flavobacterium sp. LB3P21 TaxID=3401719 RepID=UPI003AAB3E10
MTNITLNLKSPRIEVVDALRGFAIMSIMLLHNVEHFEYYHLPENFPAWLVAMDKIVWDSMFFIFGGKSYAIFALLFGFSFYIQNDNQAKKGNDFRGRFFWRMMLLLVFWTNKYCILSRRYPNLICFSWAFIDTGCQLE